MIEIGSGYLTSGIIEMGPRRTNMQDAALKVERSEDGYVSKVVLRRPGEKSLRKDVFGYPDSDPRFARSVQWLQFLEVNSIRLVVDGVTISQEARVENAGGHAAQAAVEGIGPLFFAKGIGYEQFYDRQRRVFDYAGFVAESMQGLSRNVREKGRGGTAVAVLALETGRGVYVAFVGDPVVEWMSKEGRYQIIGTPDNLVWEGIMTGEITEEPPGSQSLSAKAKKAARVVRRVPEHLHYWEIFESVKNSPANVVRQTLGQRSQLDLRRHVFFIPKDPKHRSIIGLGTDGIQKVVPARERLGLFKKAHDSKDFVARLRRVAASRYRLASDNVAYRMIPL